MVGSQKGSKQPPGESEALVALFGSKKGLVGVDIGSSAVKAVELKPGGRGGEFHLVKLGLEPLPPEAIVDALAV